ncbi:MAG: glycoside hydrolase family 2 protein [Chloroflexi bacterium]|nr:glycoside hydrolase family 2 protein [Chloroflexota bacterium]
MEKVSLNGAWRVSQTGESGPARSGSIAAQVPGCIHTDLIAAGKIPNPYYRDNEHALQWIGEVDWVYSRNITVPASLLKHEKVLLRCEGLDTFATITLNGAEVARTNNMFRTWEFDVKHLLKPGRNTIEVRFDSTIPYIMQKQSERYLHGWSPEYEVSGRAWVRKEPCNYGWDWGPVFITCGIWRAIELVGFNAARLTGVKILQNHDVAGQVTLDVTPELESLGEAPLSTRVTVAYAGEAVSTVTTPAPQAASLAIANPRLWWPNNLGDQPLYDVNVELLDGQGQVLDSTSRRMGLRTLVLDRHPDQWGESFQFVVNGIPFFAKGGNWIPADTFATAMTHDRYHDLLQSVKDANMNMLRLWGGGIYEQDVFYDLCDELGICIWHDFMFACSTYPTFDEDFLSNVRAEAEDNVRRVRHHPSIALWCGNNELEQGLVSPEWTDRTMSWDDYGKLFDTLLPAVTGTLDPQRSYWPASPHTPCADRSDFNNPTCGDAHLWDVWHGRRPFEWYRTCTHRFNSEFGFQSFPEPKTVYGYTEPEDRNVTTYVMELHQRSGIGNAVIMHYMLDWFRLPASFEMTLYLSQILQGMAMKYAVEHWRRAMPRGMGTLYWQIDDCWPVASWSSIDYHGHWKALQYMAKKFYAPILVSAVEDTGTGKVEIHLTNDTLQASAGDVAWRLTDAQGKSLARGKVAAQIDPLKSALVETLDLSGPLKKHGARNLMLWLEYVVKGKRISTNFATFARPKHLELADPAIQLQAESLGDNQFEVTLTAAKPALWAWLELDGIDARFSDGFMHLFPGGSQRVAVTPAKPLTLKQFNKALRVYSLLDTYR